MHEGSHKTRRNGRTAMVLSAVVVGMIGLSFASVPLYRLFTQVTGYGGTTRTAEALPNLPASDRVFKVRFNADVGMDLPWSFQPLRRSVYVRVGEPGRALFRVRNLSDRAIVGKAAFNATPMKIGKYFTKVECFCFDEQRLAPGQIADMAVSFYIDPGILEDRNVAEVKAITLSYTFFRRPDGGRNEVPDGAKNETQVTQRSASAKLLN